jgi:tRNA dimethylallyltransferase
MLWKLDLQRAKTIDKYNARRIIRAIEIATALGKVPSVKVRPSQNYNPLFIGLTLPPDELKKKISIRLFARIGLGMILEAKRLHKNGLSWKRMEELGLEYRYLAKFLKKEITKDDMIKRLEYEIWHYAKRQMTWFKRDDRILWHAPTRTKQIQVVIRRFVTT